MNVLMIIAPQDFRDEEFAEPRLALEEAGHTVTVASTRPGPCVGVHGARVEAGLGLAAVATQHFDGVVFVGGPGARELFDNPDAHRIAVELNQQRKVVAAICIAPVILARAGLLAGKRATVFQTEVRALADARAAVSSQAVVADGLIVTASGPAHARAFGERVVKALAESSGKKAPRARSAERAARH